MTEAAATPPIIIITTPTATNPRTTAEATTEAMTAGAAGIREVEETAAVVGVTAVAAATESLFRTPCSPRGRGLVSATNG